MSRRSERIGDLLEQFRSSSIQARNLGRCFEVWENALRDPKRPTIFLGLSGPLIAAGLRKVLRDLIDWGLVDVVVSTGAVLYQDLYQSVGGRHWMGSPTADDLACGTCTSNRIYDTYVDELKFEDTDRVIGRITESLIEQASSREFLGFLGSRFPDPDSILATAARRGVQVLYAALIDSSINDHALLPGEPQAGGPLHPRRGPGQLRAGATVSQSPRTGVIYIGGGTPN